MSPEMITMIALGIAIMGVQMTTFIYTLRRMDAMQKEISDVHKEVSEVRVDMAHMRTDLTERVARLEGILIGQQQMAANGAPGPGGDD